MTALCTGGTSAPKAGLPSVIDYALSTIAELLIFKGVRWPIFALPLIDAGPLTLASFCASDPPAMPTFTSAETEAVLKLQFGADFDAGIAKFKDLVLHTLWYDACECTSGTAVVYAPPSIPSGTPQYRPPQPQVAVPCRTDAITTYSRSAGGGPTFAGFLLHAPPPAANMVRVTSTVYASTGNFNVTVELRRQTLTSPIANGTISSFSQGPGVLVHDYPFDIQFPSIAVYLTGAAGTGNRDVDVTAEYYCGDQIPGSSAIPCCPPDETTQAQLDILVKMVTLIQRQSVPFAYVYGTNHPGLTGDGEISPVGGLIGLSVDVTTLPSSYGRASGTPERLFDLGFVTLGTTDGWLESRRIDADGSLVLPAARAGVFTRIGYTLAAGVEVAIRELVREP